MHIRIAAVTATLICNACAYEDEDVAFRDTGTGSGSGGGTVFNTNIVDDELVSELRQPMGLKHLGVSLDGIELAGGEVVESFVVDDGEVIAVDEQGVKHAGDAVVGSEWALQIGVTTWMSSLKLAERVDIDGWPHYRFRKGLLASTCRSTSETVYARLLTGFTLDETTGDVSPLSDNTYVACTNGATGKAAAWGYYDLAVGLGDFTPFEVAIRAIRADYCYDGVSHTSPGVPLLIQDRWKVRDASKDAALEAVWGAAGLICANAGRKGEIPMCGGQPIAGCLGPVSFANYPEALFITRLP